MMVKFGSVFTYDGKTAQTLNYLPNLDLWVCRYCDGSNLVFLFTKEIEERMKKNMKLEYKFYEKNLAPKWLEGDYDLHIKGNKMVMTSKDGVEVKARCHPDDDWRLQVGIDELKERMAEAKKSREIKVGDVVRFKHNCVDWYLPHDVCDWCEYNDIMSRFVMWAYKTNEKFDPRDRILEARDFEVFVRGEYRNQTLAYIIDINNQYGFIVDTEWLELVP